MTTQNFYFITSGTPEATKEHEKIIQSLQESLLRERDIRIQTEKKLLRLKQQADNHARIMDDHRKVLEDIIDDLKQELETTQWNQEEENAKKLREEARKRQEEDDKKLREETRKQHKEHEKKLRKEARKREEENRRVSDFTKEHIIKNPTGIVKRASLNESYKCWYLKKYKDKYMCSSKRLLINYMNTTFNIENNSWVGAQIKYDCDCCARLHKGRLDNFELDLDLFETDNFYEFDANLFE